MFVHVASAARLDGVCVVQVGALQQRVAALQAQLDLEQSQKYVSPLLPLQRCLTTSLLLPHCCLTAVSPPRCCLTASLPPHCLVVSLPPRCLTAASLPRRCCLKCCLTAASLLSHVLVSAGTEVPRGSWEGVSSNQALQMVATGNALSASTYARPSTR